MESESLNHSHYLVPILPEDAEILVRDVSDIMLFYFEASVEELDSV